MAHLIPDSMDFSAYMRATDVAAKVRPASDFAAELEAECAPKGPPRSVMFSTKLRQGIEFRPGEVTVWAGFNGHRKSMFTGQVALDMCVQREPALIVSLEMRVRKTLLRMACQAFVQLRPTADERRRFMDWTDGRLWLFDHVGRMSPDLCLAVCRYFAEEHKGRHVFIDSFMKVVQSEDDMNEQKAFVGDLCDLAKETDLHIHLVAHCRKPNGGSEDKPPSKYDIKGSGAITDQPHNVITIWENKAKREEREKPMHLQDAEKLKRPDTLISIAKQRNGEFEGVYGLWLHEASMRFCDDGTSAVEPYYLS